MKNMKKYKKETEEFGMDILKRHGKANGTAGKRKEGLLDAAMVSAKEMDKMSPTLRKGKKLLDI